MQDLEKISRSLELVINLLTPSLAEFEKAEETIHTLAQAITFFASHQYFKDRKLLEPALTDLGSVASLFATNQTLKKRAADYLRSAAEWANDKQYDPQDPFPEADLLKEAGNMVRLIDTLKAEITALMHARQ